MEPMIGIGQATPASQHVKDSDTDHFMTDVIEASASVPVIVDFWAPWCGPCRQLGPALEKAVNQVRGAVKLVKINVDENQALAAQLRIQSIPSVLAFTQGRPVDGFVGALPESQVKAFVARLAGDGLPPQAEEIAAAARAALDEGDGATAAAMFRQILAQEPGNTAAIAGLARCHLADGNLAKAREVLATAPQTAVANADIAAAESAIALAEETASAGDAGQLARRLESAPDDHQARFDLALALLAAGRREEAVDQLLELLRRDREWNDQAARRQLVKMFDAFGGRDPLTVSARRRMSALLFS